MSERQIETAAPQHSRRFTLRSSSDGVGATLAGAAHNKAFLLRELANVEKGLVQSFRKVHRHHLVVHAFNLHHRAHRGHIDADASSPTGPVGI